MSAIGKAISQYTTELKEAIRYPGYSAPGTTTSYGSWAEWFQNAIGSSNSTILVPQKMQEEVGNMEHIAAVCAVNHWVTRRLQEPPIVVKELLDDGTEETVKGHPLTELMDTMNPFMDYSDFIEEYWWGKTTDGNSYFAVLTDKKGEPREIWPLPYWLTKPRWDTSFGQASNSYIDYYSYYVYGQEYNYLPASAVFERTNELARRFKADPYAFVVHFKNRRRRGRTDSDLNLRQGVPLYASIIPELAGDQKSVLFQLALLENGGVPKMILSPAQGVITDTKQLQQLAAEIQRKTTKDNAGNVLVLGTGLKAEQMSFSPAELRVESLREMTQNALCQLINVDPSVIKFSVQVETGTKANRKQANEDAAESFLIPEWRLIEKTLTAQLLPLFEHDTERLKRQRVEFNLTKVRALQEDENARAERLRADLVSGALRLKDYQSERQIPVDPKADYYLIPQTLEVVTDEIRDIRLESVKLGLQSAQLGLQQSQAQPVQDGNITETQDGGTEQSAQKPPQKPPKSEKSLPIEYTEDCVKELHTYATTQVVLPAAEAQKLPGIEIAPEDLTDKGYEKVAHITVKYGLHEDNVAKVRRVIEDEPPARVRFGRTDYFSAPNYDVLYVSVDSPDLARLNQLLTNNLANTTTHNTYTPHVTLAYLKSGTAEKYLQANPLEGLQMVFDTIEFRDRVGSLTNIELLGVRESAE